MPNQYKARLAALGLTQTSLLPQLRQMTGMCINVAELSAAITGAGVQRKHQRILQAVEEILSEKESECMRTA